MPGISWSSSEDMENGKRAKQRDILDGATALECRQKLRSKGVQFSCFNPDEKLKLALITSYPMIVGTIN